MFETTRWSLVQAAGSLRGSVAREAFGALGETYWYPLYAYARRDGCPPEAAEDRVQEYFAFLLTGTALATADPLRGRFRSFLLKSFQNFLKSEHRRETALKRGGGRVVQSLDGDRAEARYVMEPADTAAPDRLFERQWALTLLEATREEIRREYESRGQGTLFAGLEAHLRQDPTQVPYAALGVELDLTEEALKAAAHRLRKRFRELLRRAVAETLVDPAEIDDELKWLLRAVSGE